MLERQRQPHEDPQRVNTYGYLPPMSEIEQWLEELDARQAMPFIAAWAFYDQHSNSIIHPHVDFLKRWAQSLKIPHVPIPIHYKMPDVYPNRRAGSIFPTAFYASKYLDGGSSEGDFAFQYTHTAVMRHMNLGYTGQREEMSRPIIAGQWVGRIDWAWAEVTPEEEVAQRNRETVSRW